MSLIERNLDATGPGEGTFAPAGQGRPRRMAQDRRRGVARHAGDPADQRQTRIAARSRERARQGRSRTSGALDPTIPLDCGLFESTIAAWGATHRELNPPEVHREICTDWPWRRRRRVRSWWTPRGGSSWSTARSRRCSAIRGTSWSASQSTCSSPTPVARATRPIELAITQTPALGRWERDAICSAGARTARRSRSRSA